MGYTSNLLFWNLNILYDYENRIPNSECSVLDVYLFWLRFYFYDKGGKPRAKHNGIRNNLQQAAPKISQSFQKY